MTGKQSEKSPLARLVLLMICLSVAGGVVAGAHYFAVDLPKQSAEAALRTPLNNNEEADAIACLKPQPGAEEWCCRHFGICT